MPGMSERFRARNFDSYQPPAQITGTVAPAIEVQAREIAPPLPSARGDNWHTVFCVSVSIPATCAIGAVIAGDIRAALILLLVTLAIALVGLFTLDGPW